MTQAFNLSQLANNLNSVGQLDATDGLTNAVPVANGGTGASTASAARSNLGVPSLEYAVPAGGIIMWSGSVASIPSGWFLCNGANGTPDLRDRFVVGAGSSYAVAASGGSKDAVVVSHSHTATSTVTDSGHLHNYAISEYEGGVNYGTNYYINNSSAVTSGRTQFGTTSTQTTGVTVATTVNSSGTSGTNANLPPYYALAFIMKS
jgi:hypothetical protein